MMAEAQDRHRFTILGFKFIRRSVSLVPPDGTLCFVDNGHPTGWSDRMAARFKNGEWTSHKGGALRFEPNYWTVLDLEGHGHG